MASYIDQISSSGPKVWYRFNETSGTPVNSGSLSTTSSFIDLLLNEQTDVDGRCVYLNGSSSYVQLPAHAEFTLFNDRSFTVETWVKILNADTNRTSPLEIFRLNAPSSPHYVVTLSIDGTAGTRGKVRLGSTWTTDILSTNTIDDGQWHHIVYTYNTSSVKLYIDGTLNTSTTPTNLPASFNFDQSTKKLIGAGYVGTAQTTISQYLKGRIDEFAAYDYELTSTTILANYNAGASVEIASGSFGTATSLMVQPVLSAEAVLEASPMTANAASGDHYNSTVTFPTLLDTYMKTLTLQTRFKFDKYKTLTNYGTEPTRTSLWNTGTTNDPGGGVQGSGELKMFSTGQAVYQFINATTGDVALLNDENFTIGFWTKKLDKPSGGNHFIMTAFKTGGTESVNFFYNTDGGITFRIVHNSSNHDVASTVDITDGNWHFVVGKLSSNTMQLWIDSTSIGTTAMTGNFTLDYFQFDSTGTTDTISVSQFFITTAAAIGTTEIDNIWDYGTPSVLQGAAYMPDAAAKFNSAYNDYIEAKTPVIDVRLDEGTGSPKNYGTAGISLTPHLSPQGYTQGEIGLNGKAFKFTSRDQTVRGNYSLDAGTFSTDDVCTIGVLFKNANATNQQGIIGFGGRNTTGLDGNGFSLQMLATSGYLRILAGAGNGTVTNYTGTTNYSDNKWHQALIVKSASTIKLYVDGKEHITGSNSTQMTDNGEFIIAGIAGIVAAAASRDTLIDEAFVTNTAFTAQQAFETWQSLRLEMDTTATALMTQPTTILGTGNIYTAAVATASADIVNPTEEQEIAPLIAIMNAHALFQHPNFGGNVVIDVNYGQTAFMASALFHMPAANIGENHIAVDMEASALMVNPITIAGGSISVNPGIALNATLVDPGIVTIKGALVKAQTFNANAFAPLPPAYFTIADDLWYQRLVEIDQKSPTIGGNITFFNTSDNIYVAGEYASSGWKALAGYNEVTNPLPAAYGGYFDGQNRKALNFRNITLTTGGPGSNVNTSDVDFTFEVMIKTTKSNQVLFVGENYNSYNTQRTGIILKDGKLALTYSKDSREGKVLTSDSLAFTGFKNIADGQWHHVIIQNRQTGVDQTQPRIQFWVDGELDIQRYGNEMYLVNQIGYNSADLNSYSDFTLSVAALNKSSMVEENEITLNYLAAFNIIPVKAEVATASVTMTPNNKGRGNRGRALMLYFWPTQNASTGIYAPTSASGPFTPVGNNYHNFDQGGYGTDPDTFYQLTTYTTNGANKFYDWDIWPCPVTSLPSGDTWVGESHPILKDGIFKSGTDKGTVYVDAVTDNERYLNLMTDLKDLSQFDMICFRNYPDQSNEQDQFGVNAKGVVDEYFNLLDKNLFSDFLKSLREAVDTGISLFITNPQLAVDMGFIDTYHEVTDLAGAGNEGLSDPYVPIKINDPLATGTPVLSTNYPTDLTIPGNENTYLDAYRNNYHEVVNTLTDLTDDASFIWKDEIRYDASGAEYGELDRWWSRIEYKNGLQVGDRFLMSTTPSLGISYFAAPISAVKAGKVITKFADTYRHGLVERVNPYRNYATAIAVEPGTVVAGKQIGAKVFISFTDVVGTQQTGRAAYGWYGQSVEQRAVSLKSDYWVNYAYDAGVITLDEKNTYLNAANNIDNLYPNGGAVYNALSYWTLNGEDILGAASPFGDNTELTTDTSENVRKGRTVARTRRRKSKSVASTGALPNFSITWGWQYPNISVPIPSINTRALWWLSERLEYGDDIPQRPEAFNADGFMPQPVITGFKAITVNAQPGLAVGAMIETNLRSADVVIGVLPLTATALFAERGTIVPAEVATASARIAEDIGTITLESDQVVLYLVHVDPILYLREEVIK